ncbi:alpha/beta-hydrolase [Periconia macrospinosa]|uniref:Alpha/beta-hydrolase n=1 Tax=Periconia macrospinosa TaxID=97972 RepID=A0A2V1E781_9PLEO|nr:alpha/beta-hydrolase [Periconia macrospinosa]
MQWKRGFITFCLTGLVTAVRYSNGSGCNSITQIEGCESVGQIKNINGVDIYQSLPPDTNNRTQYKTILFVTDFYGIASINNRLLADKIALTNYRVVMPDLFNGDPVPMSMREGTPALNLTDWWARHPVSEIDAIVASTIVYIKESEIGGDAQKLGAVGYCLGGKHVPRFMATGKGIDVGFIAHPANLTTDEVQAISGPISIAAGELDDLWTKPLRRGAIDILEAENSTYQQNLYSGALHGFGVRPNINVARERYAKEAAYVQAIELMDAWL